MRSFVSVLLLSTALASVAHAEAPSAEAADTAEVAEVVVTGRVERLYRTRTTTVGKGLADPLDIAQSVTVLNEELYEDQGARDAADLYRNIAGVSFFSYSGVTFRGFRQATGEIYYDNLRGNPFIGFSVPQLFNIERVEVLKGPAGMLYGPGSPGGLINYVTKTRRRSAPSKRRLCLATEIGAAARSRRPVQLAPTAAGWPAPEPSTSTPSRSGSTPTRKAASTTPASPSARPSRSI
jgi:outer membrane receptor protein involved in Fe transport